VFERVASVLHPFAAACRPRTLLLAAPRASCAGVERAIETVELTLERFGPPVYVRRQIVHNSHVVAGFERRGVIFVDEIDDVPEGAPVVLSAHGVSPAVRAAARERRLDVIDATCPLVSKVHAEARRFAASGHTVVLIGHEEHEEIVGTRGEAPRHTVVLDPAQDVATLEVDDPQRVAYLTQTTLAVDDVADSVAALRARFPALTGPRASDICYATQNRQDAVAAIAAASDLVLVVGSGNSSNSRRLVEIAERRGVPARLIDDESAIEPSWLAASETIGVTAGASAPEWLVQRVVAAIAAFGPTAVHERRTVREQVTFKPPRFP
jgi:4-hydroxy-3-methylbut-2-enyl diphosphate reductase